MIFPGVNSQSNKMTKKVEKNKIKRVKEPFAIGNFGTRSIL
jgi:hypothetical protein